MPIFAQYTFDDTTGTVLDSATGNGEQNGLYINGATPAGGQAVLDGVNDLVKISTDPSFQLARGTLEISFSQAPDSVETGPTTILSRDSSDPSNGGFRIQTLADGTVQITHESASGSAVYATAPGFQSPGDVINVTYSWDVGGTGGFVSIENATTGTSFNDTVPNTVSMDMGAENQSWIIGAGQELSPAGTLKDINQHYHGSASEFTVSDTVDNTPTGSGGPDGIVDGTASGDLIDTTYLGDPNGDRVDNNDALLPGEVGNDDIIRAGGGNDTVVAGLGDDEITGAAGDDVIFGGAGDDFATGDAGNDSLSGDAGDDTLAGGLGNDTIDGGQGTNVLSGGADRDVFNGGTAGSSVDGGGTGDDFDTLDLRGLGPLRVVYDPANAENGTVEFLDSAGAVTGNMTFVEIENVLLPDDPANGGPVANPDVATTAEDEDVTIDVVANDTDPSGQPLTVTSATAGNGEVNLNSDGTITYSPFSDFNGTDTITYTVTDPDGNTSTSTVAVTVTPVNDAPEAMSDAAATPLDTPVIIDVLANDTDPDGDVLSIVGVPTSADGAVVVNPDGTITFTPNPGFIGSAVINYTMTDGTVEDSALVVVQVGGAGRDGIVRGTEGGDLIDGAYVDPTDGDRVDAGDAIIPGDGPNDDRIVAGGGDDTILAGLGNDLIFAGAGNDEVFGGPGNETVYGGAGDDTIIGNGGLEEIFGDDGDDLIDTRTGDPLPDIDYPGLYGADTNPFDNRDTVYGGDGNDTIFTGDDADRVFGRNGNDFIDGGVDNDSLYGNAGSDTIIGSEGRDFIDGGRGNDLIFGGLDLSFPDAINIPNDAGDLRPQNNADEIFGGFGNDTIYGMDDDDTINGDQGNDLIYGGVDNDSMVGADGNDTIFGDHGNDLADGGNGNDLLFGGIGDDTLSGGLGNDTVNGDAGDDTLTGEDGDDVLSGGAGNDNLDGGVNNDTLTGGTGADTLTGGFGRDLMDLGTDGVPDDMADFAFGGADEDTIIGAGVGDQIFGGGDGGSTDQDVLDLRNSGPRRIVDRVTDSDGNGFDGRVEFLDADGNVTGSATFTNIENIVCFTPGTLIATPRGEVAVENLRVGDKVVTRDNGLQEIRWMGGKQMGWHDFAANPHLKPIMVKAGSLGNGLPERDTMLSPNHRLLVANDRTSLYFDEHEVLVAAKHLVGGNGIRQVDSSGTTYHHFMFDQHEVVLSNGAWTESFQPGDYTLKGLGNAQRTEVFELFPELKTDAGVEAYQAARKTLKKHEASLLVR